MDYQLIARSAVEARAGLGLWNCVFLMYEVSDNVFLSAIAMTVFDSRAVRTCLT